MISPTMRNFLCSALAFLSLAFFHLTAMAASDSAGTDFYLSFQPNQTDGGNPTLTLFITGKEDTQGTVRIPGLAFEQPFSVIADQITPVVLPTATKDLIVNGVRSRGVIVSAEKEITVYGLNQKRNTTDAFLALPVDVLGLEHIAITYLGIRNGDPSQLAVVGVFDNTQVTITPSVLSKGRAAGVPFTINLNSADVYYLEASGSRDLTGTTVTSTSPVAVMSGAECSFIPFAVRFCDHLVEMMPAVATWGESFLTVPLATRLRGDLIRVLASQNSTKVTIDGIEKAVLNRGQFFEQILTTPSQIATDKPALVAQYSLSTRFDGVVSDPFLMLIPPSEQFLSAYTFSTPATIFTINFVNVVVPTSDVDFLKLDGQPVDVSLFSPIGSTGFSGAQIPIGRGSHTISGAGPFGIHVYGFASTDSYGYPGGMAFEFINPFGDSFPPNVKLMQFDDSIQVTATDNEDINVNGILDVGEDLNGNSVIDRRTEDINDNGQLDPGEDLNANGVIDRDTGLLRIELTSDSTNLQLDLASFVPGALEADFSITLIDPQEVGIGTLVVTDGAGNAAEVPISLSLVARLTDVQVISTISTANIDLDSTSFSLPPFSIDAQTDQTVIEWRFDSFRADQIEDVGFDLILRDPVPGEERLVTHKVELLYKDVNGNAVRTELGPQLVNVLPSIFDLSVDTDREIYTANEQVLITTTLANLSEFAANAAVRLSVKDAQGALVTEVAVLSDVPLTAGGVQQLVGNDFPTGTILEGQYEVHAELLDASGQPFVLAVAPFLIVSSAEQKVSAAITTDKQVYAPLETVNIQDRIVNETINVNLEGYTATTKIFDPSGALFWSITKALPQLLPGALEDLNYAVPLQRALAGTYRLMLLVGDADGVERAFAETEIVVQSTADTGSGLFGDLVVSPDQVLRTELLSLSATVRNFGNSNIQDLPLTLSIIDPANQQVVIQWSETVTELATDGQFAIEREWQALAEVGSTLIAVLNADVGGKSLLLAEDAFVVGEKIESDFSLGPRGRLLVLLDGTRCDGLTSVELSTTFLPALADTATVLTEVYDAQGILVDSETVEIIDFTGVVDANLGSGGADLAITDFSRDSLSLAVMKADTATGALDTMFSVVASVSQNGELLRIDSGPVDTGCTQPVAHGDIYGGFVVSGFTALQPAEPDVSDPHGPTGAPDVIEQRQLLEGLLEREGWSFTIVTNAESFEHELRGGGYAVYLLLSEHVQIEQQVEKELREAVFRGEGLVLAGRHDQRNGRIGDALGIIFKGKHSNAVGLELIASELFPDDQALLAMGDKTLRAETDGADVVGRLQFEAGKEPKANSSDIAVTINSYGAGRTVYGGFDLLGEATIAGDNSVYVDLLLNALDVVTPAFVPTNRGGVIPLRLTLTNLGTDTPGRADINLPDGSEIVDPGLAALESASTLIWPFDIANNQTVELDFWLRLPNSTDAVSIPALIQLGVDPDLLDYGTEVFELQPQQLPTVVDARMELELLAAFDARFAQALNHLDLAELAIAAGDDATGLAQLIKTTDKLLEIIDPQADPIRRIVDDVILDVARRL